MSSSMAVCAPACTSAAARSAGVVDMLAALHGEARYEAGRCGEQGRFYQPGGEHPFCGRALTATMTATAAANACLGHSTAARHAWPSSLRWTFARPEKRTAVLGRRSTEHLTYALRACPRDRQVT